MTESLFNETVVAGAPSGTLNEAQWQAQVIDLARLYGWMVAHFGAAMVQRQGKVSYRTPARADGKGFPDLVLVHPLHGVLFRELKTDKGRVRPEQEVWLRRLELAGANAAIWRPCDFDEVHEELRGHEADPAMFPGLR